jgi:hypothetical protein
MIRRMKISLLHSMSGSFTLPLDFTKFRVSLSVDECQVAIAHYILSGSCAVASLHSDIVYLPMGVVLLPVPFSIVRNWPGSYCAVTVSPIFQLNLQPFCLT